jgi:acyl-coenzyme A synthetase/AMP-(fatty) acid ligase
MELCSLQLSRLHQPQHILQVEAIPLTSSGKIDRATAKKMALEHIATSN